MTRLDDLAADMYDMLDAVQPASIRRDDIITPLGIKESPSSTRSRAPCRTCSARSTHHRCRRAWWSPEGLVVLTAGQPDRSDRGDLLVERSNNDFGRAAGHTCSTRRSPPASRDARRRAVSPGAVLGCRIAGWRTPSTCSRSWAIPHRRYHHRPLTDPTHARAPGSPGALSRQAQRVPAPRRQFVCSHRPRYRLG